MVFSAKNTPIDWAAVMGVHDDIEALTKPGADLKPLQDLVEPLCSYRLDPDKDVDAKQLASLFQVTQLALDITNADAKHFEKQYYDLEAEDDKEIKDLLAKIKGMEADLARANDTIEDLTSDLLRAEEELKDNAGRGDAADRGGGERGHMRDKVRELERELDRKDRDLQMAQDALSREQLRADDMKQDNRDMMRKMTELENDNARMHDERQELLQQLEKSERDFKARDATQSRQRTEHAQALATTRKYQKEVQALSEKNEALMKENKRLEALNDEIDDLTAALDQTQQELEDALRRLDGADDQSGMKAKEMEALRARVRELQDEAGQKEVAEKKLMARIQEQIAGTEEALTKKDKEMESMAQELKRLRATVRQLEREAAEDSMYRQIEDLKDEIASYEMKVDRLEDEIEELREEARELNDEIQRVDDDYKEQMTQKEAHFVAREQRLRESMEEKEKHLKDELSKFERMKQELLDKEEDLLDVKRRNEEYERGVYGLSNAVQEVKELKVLIRQREEHIDSLLVKVNDHENMIEDMHDEIVELRKLAGVSPDTRLDLSHYKGKTKRELDQLKTLNMQYEREIDKLEAERLELRDQLRHYAIQRGDQAMKLGLTPLQLEKMQAYSDYLKSLEDEEDASQNIPTRSEFSELEAKHFPLRHPIPRENSNTPVVVSYNVDAGAAEADRIRQFRSKIEELTRENNTLREALSVVQATRESQARQSHSPQRIQRLRREYGDEQEQRQPAIDVEALIEQLDGRQRGREDDRLVIERLELENRKLQNDIEALHGQHAVLKEALAGKDFQIRDLRDTIDQKREECEKLSQQRDALGEKLQKQSLDAMVYGPGGKRNASVGDIVGSSDEIANLNMHLLECLEELSQREDEIKETHAELLEYKLHFGTLVQQQQLLYAEHGAARVEWKKQRAKLEERLENLDAQNGSLQLQVRELSDFQRLLPSQSEESIKKLYAEDKKKLILLQGWEEENKRKKFVAAENERLLRAEVDRMQLNAVEMEHALKEQITNLRHGKAQCHARVGALMNVLETSVRREDMEIQKRNYRLLKEKFSQLLEQRTDSYLKGQKFRDAQLDSERLAAKVEELEAELAATRDKLRRTQVSNDFVATRESDSLRQELSKLQANVVTLEVSEGQALRRTELAMKKLSISQEAQAELEQRIAHLEERNLELTKQAHLLQEAETRALNAAEGSISRNEAQRLKDDILALSLARDEAVNEAQRQKELADLSNQFSLAMKNLKGTERAELARLRKTLDATMAKSDTEQYIGTLQLELVTLERKEEETASTLETIKDDIRQEQALRFRLEQMLDDKENQLFRHREDSRKEIAKLKSQLDEISSKNAGALSVEKAELWSQKIKELAEEKRKIDSGSAEWQKEHRMLELERDEACEQVNRYMAIVDALKQGPDKLDDAILVWTTQVQQLRLIELRLTREVNDLRERELYLTNVKNQLERTIREAEERSIGEQTRQDLRERELQRRIEVLEEELKGNKERLRLAERSPMASLMPSSSSAPKEDDSASDVLQSKNFGSQSEELVALRQHIKQARADNQRLVAEVAAKDDEINNLTWELTTLRRGSNRDGATSNSVDGEDAAAAMGAIARKTIQRLQDDLEQKSDTISKFQQLLKDVRDAAHLQRQQDLSEIQRLQDQLSEQQDVALSDLKRQIASHQPDAPAPEVGMYTAGREEIESLEAAVKKRDETIRDLKAQLSDQNFNNEHAHSSLSEEVKQLKEELRRKNEENAELASRPAVVPGKSLEKVVKQLRVQLQTGEKKTSRVTTSY